ncbi:MAG: exonuclease domain-containing protein, partial [Tabrizicola sp.]
MTSKARRLRVIDYETTGVPEDAGAEVIELAYVDVDPDALTVTDRWQSFAKPVGPIPPQVKAVHHILEEDVAGAPAIRELWPLLFQGCGPHDILVAHNASFEQHFHKGDGRAWIDTYKCALVVWPDAPAHRNQVLRYWLNLDHGTEFDRVAAMPPHRALPDAYVTAHVLIQLLRAITIDEMLRISAQPALLRRIGFGKHRGMLFSDAPVDYLRWIVDKAE